MEAIIPAEARMTTFSCQQILSGAVPRNTPATVKGWVRTRRDSKAGISFVNVSDGSCFHPLQVVAPDTLANYLDQVLHLTAGCAVEATGSSASNIPIKIIPPAMPRMPELNEVMTTLMDIAVKVSREGIVADRTNHAVAAF